MSDKKNEIILFENQGVKLEVNVKDETVWLNLDQMAELFGRDKSVISRHIKNALAEELKDDLVVAKFATTTKHGAIEGKTQTHMVDYYNLDVIISIGYRVKSNQGVVFRKWANKVLKDYMIKGYAVNQRRLEYLEKTIKLIDIANRIDDRLENDDAKEILKVIGEYSRALDMLDEYDHKRLKKPKGNVDTRIITYEDCITIINSLKYKEESELFGIERDSGLKAILGNVYQSFSGQDIYNSIEEKAANLLYLVVKNHVFIDGNKRIAATLFIYFLKFYGILYNENGKVIDNHTLTALTLLVAESNPKEKEVMIDLIMNFLTE